MLISSFHSATTSTTPAAYYWGIDQTITYGTSTSILSNNAGIVDTGTTLLLIATDAFQKYQQATGATLDKCAHSIHSPECV